MVEFKNGDVLRNVAYDNVEVVFIGAHHSKKNLFVGCELTNGGYRYDAFPYGCFELKPKKEKRWIAVWSDGLVYHTHNVNKETLKSCVERGYVQEYADKAQYIQIEIEV